MELDIRCLEAVLLVGGGCCMVCDVPALCLLLQRMVNKFVSVKTLQTSLHCQIYFPSSEATLFVNQKQELLAWPAAVKGWFRLCHHIAQRTRLNLLSYKYVNNTHKLSS